MREIPPLLKKCASQVAVGSAVFGRNAPFEWIAGPCAVESEERFSRTAEELKKCGIRILRGGLYKPRSSPYSFQGLRGEGVPGVLRVKKSTQTAFVTEVLDAESLDAVLPAADMIQIGSRNSLNYELLKRVGAAGRPVLLKRGFAVTMDELLNAAEYLASAGTREIILCERGIRTMTEVTRFTLDTGAIAWLKKNIPCPVIADPSHAAGAKELVAPLLASAAAAGADGAIVEVSDEPEAARCDAHQQLGTAAFAALKRRMESTILPGIAAFREETQPIE